MNFYTNNVKVWLRLQVYLYHNKINFIYKIKQIRIKIKADVLLFLFHI